MRSKYCKCLNTYTIDNCDCENVPYYWSQGIGQLTNQNNGTIGHEPRAFSDGFNKGFL